MAYRHAYEVIPADILQEIQKYIDGEYIYIPRYEEKRKNGEIIQIQDNT